MVMPQLKKPADWAWLDGEFVPWEDCKVHVRTSCVIHGENVFEGIRAYWSEDRQNLFVFRLRDHMERLYHCSMKVMRMQVPWSLEEVEAACLELLRRNGFREHVHFRPTAYFGLGEPFAFSSEAVYTGMFITAGPMPRKPAVVQGIQCCVSSWTRTRDNCMPPRVKAAPNYHNGRLGMYEARVNGYDLPLFLNEAGRVTESAGACLFLVRRGRLVTPPVTDGILESITRETVIELARRELQVETVEREVGRTELYVADEAFLCGTAAEILPVVGVDRYPVGQGKVGPITQKVQRLYFDIVEGKEPRYGQWLTPVYP
ncbi:MAG: branched-chain amino acid transaminase [Acetobacteraceae bacterium]|nr:branched-chain amino acid transaminase [Acetobacteraceae bacterium]